VTITVEPMRDAHSAAVLGIYQAGLDEGDASFETTAPAWPQFDVSHRPDLRFVAIRDRRVTGWVACSPVSSRSAYRGVVEHSVYVDTRFRGLGVGRSLLVATIEAAERQDYHVLVGGIDASNTVSIKLHESLGFTSCGIVKQAGFKFGRWLDLAFYQLILKTPSAPADG